jgi:CRP/FNR family cyclic AMP-dependent transcriptional regulator
MKEYTPLTDLDSVISILSRISFLGGVSDSQRDEILKRFELGSFKKGEYVSRKGDSPSHIYIIRKGKIHLMLTGEDGVESKKREFNVGECFGEAALLAMNNHTASWVAAEDSQLIVLSRRALNQVRIEDPSMFSILILNLARELARKLQYTDEMMLRGEHLN